jgi:hypothetical protein
MRAVARGSWRCGQVLSGKWNGAKALDQYRRAFTVQSEQWHAGRFQTREQQRDTGQGRARFGRARAEVRRGGSGQTHTKGDEVAHGSTLARTVAEGPAAWQGRGECGLGNRRKKNNHAGRRRAGR